MLGNSEDLVLTVRIGFGGGGGLEGRLGLHENQEWVLGSANLDSCYLLLVAGGQDEFQRKLGHLLKAGGPFPSCKQQQPPSCLPASGTLQGKAKG